MLREISCAAVLMVTVTPAFAADVVWESGAPLLLVPRSSSPEGGQTSEGSVAEIGEQQPEPQEHQESTPRPPPPINPQPSAGAPQTQSEPADGDINAQREANVIQQRISELTFRLVVVGAAIGFFQIVLTASQIYYTRSATRYAGDAAVAARQSVEIADRSLRIANRAYLSVGRWDCESFRDGCPVSIAFSLVNSGHMPATLTGGYFTYKISGELPARPDYLPLLDTYVRGVQVPAQRELSQSILTHVIGTAERKDIERRKVTLYVYGCIEYEDVFHDRYPVEFFLQYDEQRKMFFFVTEPGYNYNG
jgi:hypothetical protein